MALDTQNAIVAYDAPVKDLYEVGEMPPLGHVPAKMYAWAIRRERHGPPEQSMQLEVVDTWTLDSNEVLVMVMAAGVLGIMAGSIIAFHRHHEDIQAGDVGVICSFGAGYSIGSVIVKRT